MGIKLFLNIFLNVTDVVLCRVDVVCVPDEHSMWVKRYCRIQKLVRPFYILYAIDRHQGVQHTIYKERT